MSSNTPEDFPMASLPGTEAAETYSVASGPERIAIDGNPLTANESVKTSGKKRKVSRKKKRASDVTTDKEIGRALAAKIPELTDIGGISFEYSETKKKAAVKASKERREERLKESEGDYLDCNMCGKTFLDEHKLEDHFDSEEHRSKVRDKSESKTLGDLKIFRGFSGCLCPHTPSPIFPVQQQTRASLYSDDQQGILEGNIEGVDSFEVDLLEDTQLDVAFQLNQLQEENTDLRKEVAELKRKLDPETSRPKLEEFIVGLKKNEIKGDLKQYEYELGTREFYRMMSGVLEGCNSIQEREKKLVLCCLKIKRGKYDKCHGAQNN